MRNVFLSSLTTLGIGGRADEVYAPVEREFDKVYNQACQEHERVLLLGRGSKVLAADAGYRGGVLLTKNLDRITFAGTSVYAAAGVALPSLAIACAQVGLSGLEWAAGIPASIGGAVTLNAGAFGGSMSDIVEEVAVIDGEVRADDAQFTYRGSAFDMGRAVVKGAWLKLVEADSDSIFRRMEEVRALRQTTQPLCARTAGSAFRRVGDRSAGWYIEQCGCKELKIGGALVSPVHANFIQNVGGATCKDVQELLECISTKVLTQFGVRLVRDLIEVK